MNRRRFFALAGTLGLGGTAYAATRGPYYSGPVSDHFDGTRFFNPGGVPPRGFGDLLRWQFGGGKADWPANLPAPVPAKPAAQVADMTITMVGHASLLIQTAGLTLLTDPVWSDRASPLPFAGPRRHVAPGVAFADLPKVDAVLLTHNHYDHLDIATLRRLQATHDPLVITPLGNDTILKAAVPGLRLAVGDWGDSLALGPVQVHFVPCHHWSARSFGDRSQALWAAFVIAGPRGTILHIGDTGFDAGRPYRDLPARFGPLRAAILPIGAYEPRWFMQGQHQNPEEAVEGFVLSGARHAVGHHWGTFRLTNEAREAPLRALDAALAQRGIDPARFRALAAGQVWDVPES